MKVGFNITPLQSGHSSRGIGSYTRNLLTELKKSDLDIIEFTDSSKIENVDLIFYPWFDLFFRTLKIGDVPTIVMVHDTMPLIFPKAYPAGIRGHINFLIQKRELRKTKFVITNSETSKRDIKKYLGIDSRNIVSISLAAGSEFKVLSEPQKNKIKDHYQLPENFLMYTGDGNYVKNLPFLVKGFKLIKESEGIRDLKLILVGGVFLNNDLGHPEQASLREVHRLIKENGLEHDVITPGQVETSDLVGFYNLAKAYIQPSLYEGFGIPVLEAMLCGCPVLSSNAGSLSEVGGQAVVYFDPEDLSDMVDKISSVLEDRNLQRSLIKKGFNQSRKFSWSNTAKETINVFEQALGKK